MLRRTAFVLAVVAMSACGDAEGNDSGDAEGDGPPVVVQALDNSFVEERTTVPAGTRVVWENRGRNEHDIIPEDESAPWRVEADDFAPGAVAEFVFTEPGEYRYYCSIHGNLEVGMPGVIVVE